MPEVYPTRLLPQPEFCYIDGFAGLEAVYLCRSMPPEFLLDNGTIDATKFAFQSGHLADLSTNLLGIFRSADRKYQLTPAGKERYQRPWLEGTAIEPPDFPEHFFIAAELGAVYLQIGRIVGLEIPYNVGEAGGFSAICLPRHTPIDANFWHVSLRWENQEGDVLNQNGGWRRRMLTAARSVLVELAETEAPQQYTPIEPNRYLSTG